MLDHCPFCLDHLDRTIILENENCYAIYDGFPVSKGHVLIISKRHTANFFELSSLEQQDCLGLLNEAKKLVDREYSPDGYNVGINISREAGQTIWHVHVHLIPRYEGDVINARGGVRGVIPHKKEY
ncbi:HIT family protein [Chryseobacterium lacus]|uniref:HIT family protein n=1 Tax=Chryseobacterium lacus TaxID=2058346 RepID=A0A368MY28_9FLAO|nr:HIT family protein [Chryseobacterium lacus]RCU42304.1 HIT family protein [Chryseobacterium lacus]RST26602.1 HIT family protein [Chryseobacterium lacus]